jgi:hypothetical protein
MRITNTEPVALSVLHQAYQNGAEGGEGEVGQQGRILTI